MNTVNNIAAMKTSGATNAPLSQSSSPSQPGLLGFIDALLQQMQAGLQGGAPVDNATQPAQTAAQDLSALTEKIAAQLKKDGVSANDLQNMSPQDIAAQIVKMLQQPDIKLPPSLQSMSPDDLATQVASLIQTNTTVADASSSFKPSLTSDLVSPQSISVQGMTTDTQTKDDIAKKISDLLEKQQDGTAGLNPLQLQQLQTDFKQLQSAPGAISAATLDKLTTDVSKFLSSQGVDLASTVSFVTDLTQSLQNLKDQAAISADNTTAAVAAMPVPSTTTTASQSAAPSQTDNSSYDYTQANTISSATTPQTLNTQAKDLYKTPFFGKKDATSFPDKPAQTSTAMSQQQTQAPAPQPVANVTAKVNGISVNPALINDLANNSGDTGAGGFGSQGGDTQQMPTMTGTAALLQPLSADMLQNQNFTNYMNSASSSQASQTTQMLNIQLQSNISAGMNSMTLQLEPAELGKMNVKLSFTKDGTVKAHMTVDKPETLALLQKDSSHLQRALQQSGLTTDENSLSFDLRQQSQHNMQGFNGNGGNHADDFGSNMDDGLSSALQAQIAIQSSGYITQSGVNIMV